jgi:tetratricopeptide (TPR) repeat protein
MLHNIEQLFEEALGYHRAARLSDAERLYRQILSLDSRHADSVHLLGVLAYQAGRHDLAVHIISEAIAIDGTVAAYHSNLGIALKAQGQLDQAIGAYNTAISVKPDYSEAHYKLGLALKAQGHVSKAIDAFNTAIRLKPDYAEAHSDLGLLRKEQGHLDDAIRAYKTAIHIKPDYAAAHANLGLALKMQGHLDDAISAHNTAIRLRASDTAYSNLGTLLQEKGRLEDAVHAYSAAIHLKPDYAEAHSNLGTALQAQGHLGEAINAYNTAIRLKPDFAEAHSNLGTALHEQGHPEAAIRAYDTALRYKSDFAEVHNNIGNILQQQGDLDAAMSAYNTAIRLNANYAEALCNLALVFLKRGDYSTGFRLWEMRKKTLKPAALQDVPPIETLKPQAMAGRRVIIYWEQGLGDTIQFCRYLPEIAAHAASVSFVAPPELKAIIQDAFSSVHVITDDEVLADYDAYCPLLSLPLAFSTTLETIPATSPYLFAPRDKAAAWAARLGVKTRLRVGLVWHGGFRAQQVGLWSVNRRRNIDFAIIAGLNVAGIDFYSLQKGEPAEDTLTDEMPRYWTGNNFYNLAGELHDFTDTAALIEQLDLVISVDTSTAHLAGAMGKPVWILNRFDACWRWLQGRTETPWYPTARLFQQPKPGAWAPVIATVRAELQSILRQTA